MNILNVKNISILWIFGNILLNIVHHTFDISNNDIEFKKYIYQLFEIYKTILNLKNIEISI